MKKWIFGILIFIVGISILAYLYETGGLDFGWQTLTIIAAALAAPIKWIINIFKTDTIDEIKIKHEKIRDLEKQFQENLESSFNEKQRKIDMINKELELIDSKIKILDLKKQKVSEYVNGMSVEEKRNTFIELFGQ